MYNLLLAILISTPIGTPGIPPNDIIFGSDFAYNPLSQGCPGSLSSYIGRQLIVNDVGSGDIESVEVVGIKKHYALILNGAIMGVLEIRPCEQDSVVRLHLVPTGTPIPNGPYGEFRVEVDIDPPYCDIVPYDFDC